MRLALGLMTLVILSACLDPLGCTNCYGALDALDKYGEPDGKGGFIVYARLRAKYGDPANVKLPGMAVNSTLDSHNGWMDSKSEKGSRVYALPDHGYCAAIKRVNAGLEYRVTFIGHFKDPKKVDPHAKSFDIDDAITLSALEPLPAELAHMRTECAAALLAER